MAKILAILEGKGLDEEDKNKKRLDKMIQSRRVFCACGDPRMATPGEGLNWAVLVSSIRASSVGTSSRAHERGIGQAYLHAFK